MTPASVMLVTGATGAIGFEIAAQAAHAGTIVGVHGSRQESVVSAISLLRARIDGARLIPLVADFRTENAIEDMVSKLVGETGRLDSVVHCGITGPGDVTGPFQLAKAAHFGAHAAMVLGSFQTLCFAALPHLSVQGGTIIGFASDAGRFGSPRQAVIGGAFGGVMAFVRNLALETAHAGIRVHCISPSFVTDTPAFAAHAARADAAQSRAGLGLPSPADIAPMVLFLCGSGATKITGQIISINGGLNA
jgi:3-oxoacyl-[acyl-carrier protein] reductase